MILFGGFNGREFINDFWMFTATPSNDGSMHYSWKPVKANSHRSLWPCGRSGHSMEKWNRWVILFGGRYKVGRLNDLKIFDLGRSK